MAGRPRLGGPGRGADLERPSAQVESETPWVCDPLDVFQCASPGTRIWGARGRLDTRCVYAKWVFHLTYDLRAPVTQVNFKLKMDCSVFPHNRPTLSLAVDVDDSGFVSQEWQCDGEDGTSNGILESLVEEARYFQVEPWDVIEGSEECSVPGGWIE